MIKSGIRSHLPSDRSQDQTGATGGLPITEKLLAGTPKPETAIPDTADRKLTASQRIFDSAMRSAQKELLKDQKLIRAREKAIVANMNTAIGALDEPARADFFLALEGLASASQRKLIETHPMRPEGVTALVAEVDAARAREAEKAKAQREVERREKEREQYERLRQKFEADAEETLAPDAGKADE